MRSRAAAFFVAVALSACGGGPQESLPKWGLELRYGATMKRLRVEVASTAEARRIGLMHRTKVPEGTGMLFRYPGEGAWGGIWMKNTLVSLDVAFILRGEVIELHTLRPCRADPCPITSPAGTYDQVLEVRGGWFDHARIGVGTRVSRRLPSQS